MSVESDHSQESTADAIARLLREGDEHLRHGRGTEATNRFREALQRDPDHPVALHRCGSIAFLRGDAREASELLGRALEAGGDHPTLRSHLARALMACGRLDEAIEHWRHAIAQSPDFADAHAKLGDAYLAKGDVEASESAYRRSIALAPQTPEAHVGLGRLLHFSNRNREAEESLHRALEAGNASPEICILVGTAVLEAGGLEAALELFESAVRGEPDESRGHAGRGLALHWLGRLEEAEQAYRRALSLDPRSAPALKHLGVLLQERDQLAGAAECFEKLLQMDPDDEVAAHMLAATSGKTTAGAPAGYVTRLFDDYADRFDEHLGTIAYRVPTLIRDAVLEVGGRDAAERRILDLGCGTGLCGEILKPMAGHLAGVDLSPRMIAKARERGIYDSLMVGSIDDALQAPAQRFDVIVAGDVFTYIGELSPVLAGCARALEPGGLVALSVERSDSERYQLCPTGRYAHAPAYLKASAEAAGLVVAYCEDITLRNDPGPIPGQIVVLSRAG